MVPRVTGANGVRSSNEIFSFFFFKTAFLFATA